jgi:hypothetical protein
MSDDIIKKALGMNTDVPAPEDKALVVYEGEVSSEEENLASLDFEYIRENLQDLIAKGKEAIDELLVIAKQSQHPTAFEVIATLLKATSDMNAELMTTHKKKADLDNKISGPAHSKGVSIGTQQNVFVGSTAELQQAIENMKKNDGRQ